MSPILRILGDSDAGERSGCPVDDKNWPSNSKNCMVPSRYESLAEERLPAIITMAGSHSADSINTNTNITKDTPMKTMKTTPFITWAALTVTAAQLFSAGQASAAGYKMADKVGASIAEFRDEIINIKKEVDTTMVALDKIVTTAATDPRKAFKDFDKAVPEIEDAAKKAKKRGEDIKARGQAYFAAWEKELAGVNNAEIRQLAEERKAKLQATFGNIRTTMEPVRDQFTSWLANLKDLQKYLSNDLTIGGIDAAKELIGKAKSEGQGVQQSMDKVIAELNTIVATLTPAKAKAKK